MEKTLNWLVYMRMTTNTLLKLTIMLLVLPTYVGPIAAAENNCQDAKSVSDSNRELGEISTDDRFTCAIKLYGKNNFKFKLIDGMGKKHTAVYKTLKYVYFAHPELIDQDIEDTITNSLANDPVGLLEIIANTQLVYLACGSSGRQSYDLSIESINKRQESLGDILMRDTKTTERVWYAATYCAAYLDYSLRNIMAQSHLGSAN